MQSTKSNNFIISIIVMYVQIFFYYVYYNEAFLSLKYFVYTLNC